MTDQTAITPYKQLKNLLSSEEIKARFAEILNTRAPGFIASVLNVVYLDDNLKDADPNSIIVSALTAAALDLPVDRNLGFSWIIPYNKSKKVNGNWVKSKMARFQMGYKGYIQLAGRTGQYEGINATEIYEGQEVKVDQLTGKVRLNGQRVSDKIIGYAAWFRLLNGFEKAIYWPIEKIEEHAAKYSQSYHDERGAWTTNKDDMCKKTVLKALISKWGIMSIQMQTAIKHDAEPEESEAAPDPFAANRENAIEGKFSEPPFDPVAFIMERDNKNEFAARALLDKYVPDEFKTTPELLGAWHDIYRTWRSHGAKPEEAAEKAANGEVYQDAAALQGEGQKQLL